MLLYHIFHGAIPFPACSNSARGRRWTAGPRIARTGGSRSGIIAPHPMKRAFEWLCVAAVLTLAAVLRYTDPGCLADLAIIPDCGQYTVGGWNLAHGRGLWIYINDLKLPLQYPCGFPLILALFYLATGAALHQAIHVVHLCSLASILLAYLFARQVCGRKIGLIAAALLAVAPSYVGYSQVLISDMVSNVFIVAGLWLAWSAAVRGESRGWTWAGAGVFCGFSAVVHMLSGLTIIPLCAACLFGARGGGRRLAVPLLCALGGFAVGLAPVLLYNTVAFGNPLRTGYDYWARWGEGQSNFSLLYALRNMAVSERGDGRGNIGFFTWHFLGRSWPTLFAPYFMTVLPLAAAGAGGGVLATRRWAALPIAVVMVVAVACALVFPPAPWVNAPLLAAAAAALWFPAPRPADRGERLFSLIAASLIASVILALFFYSFQMSKFLLPIVPVVCILAARGIALLVAACRGAGVRPALTRVPAAALLALTAWGCVKPFTQGHFTRVTFPWRWHEGMEVLGRIAPPDAILVSGIDGVFVTHYFVRDTHRSYMPISRDPEYIRHRRLALPVAVENQERLVSAAAGGKKVYMDGYTYLEWGRYRAALERNFIFVPVAPYGGGALHIYELHPRPIFNPTS